MMATDVEPLERQTQEELEELLETPKDELSTEQLTSVAKLSLKRRYSFNEWCLAFEVTGENNRRADAIAIGLYPSRGWPVLGFEIKASRNDWLTEKKNPEKADFHVGQVDEWYIVAADSSIVQENELPKGWGLLEMRGSDHKLYKTVESKLTDSQDDPPSREFYHRVMKAAVGDESNHTQQDIEEARRRGYRTAKEEYEVEDPTRNQRTLGNQSENVKNKLKKYEQIKDALGVVTRPREEELDEEKLEQIRLARRIVKEMDSPSYRGIDGSLRQAFQNVESAMEQIHEARWLFASAGHHVLSGDWDEDGDAEC